MKKSLLLYQAHYHKEFEKRKAILKDREIVAINLDEDVLFENLGKSVTFKEACDYFEFLELKKIDETALNLAKNWYISDGSDLSIYRDISVGEIIQYEMMTHFVAALKSLALVSKIIEKEKIDEIILFGPQTSYEKAALILAEHKGIKVTKFFPYDNHVARRKKRVKEKSLKKRLKVMGISFFISVHEFIRRKLFPMAHQRKNVLIISPYRVLPLMRELAKEKDLFLAILVCGYIKDLFQNQFFGRKNVGLINRWPLRALLLKNDQAGQISQDIYGRLQKNIREKILETEIPGIWELIANDLPSFLTNKISGVIIDYKILDKYIIERKPNALIVVQDFKGIHRLAVALCNSRNIPTLVLQHGAVGFFPHFVSPIAKIVGIWGKKWANWFTDYLGVEEERIKVIGEPYYDAFLNNGEKFKRRDLLAKYGIPEGKKVILYPQSGKVLVSALEFPRLNEKLAYTLCKTLGNVKDYWMILKLRPGKPIHKGLRIVEQAGANNVAVISKTDNLKLLEVADLIITRGSTMAFEGMLLNKPVVVLNFRPRYRNSEFNPFLETAAVVKIDEEKDLLPAVERILSNPYIRESLARGRQEFMNEHFYSGENSSSKSLVKYIKKTLLIMDELD